MPRGTVVAKSSIDNFGIHYYYSYWSVIYIQFPASSRRRRIQYVCVHGGDQHVYVGSNLSIGPLPRPKFFMRCIEALAFDEPTPAALLV